MYRANGPRGERTIAASPRNLQSSRRLLWTRSKKQEGIPLSKLARARTLHRYVLHHESNLMADHQSRRRPYRFHVGCSDAQPSSIDTLGAYRKQLPWRVSALCLDARPSSERRRGQKVDCRDQAGSDRDRQGHFCNQCLQSSSDPRAQGFDCPNAG